MLGVSSSLPLGQLRNIEGDAVGKLRRSLPLGQLRKAGRNTKMHALCSLQLGQLRNVSLYAIFILPLGQLRKACTGAAKCQLVHYCKCSVNHLTYR